VIKLPSGVDINNLIDDLKVLSWKASDTLLYYSNLLRNSNYESRILKNENSDDPVTIADLEVNNIIIQGLRNKYKNVNWEILSEENAKLFDENPKSKSDWVWILDPLDGTKDFIQGTCNYAMHLALNYKNRPLIGIVLIPEKSELWIAIGDEVWCENRNRSKFKTDLQKNKTLKEMVLVTSKNHRNETLKKLIQIINFKEIKVMGSIGCKITSIIRGETDIYICLSIPGKSSPKDWDFAAPEAVLKASGGALTNLNNQELSYGKPNYEQGGIIIASNNVETHSKLCSEIKEIIRRYDIYPLVP
tara:strand:- start:1956 stop:2864 length:909 start_codon:yes stop_codon:yes gene_type:complete